MSNHFNNKSLVGKHIEASIGEPWDFSSTAGDNGFTGDIIAASTSSEIKPWELCEVSPFKHGKQLINQVVAINRYAGTQDFLELLQLGQFVVSNFFYRTDGEILAPDQVTAWLESGTAQSFLVGSFKLS